MIYVELFLAGAAIASVPLGLLVLQVRLTNF